MCLSTKIKYGCGHEEFTTQKCNKSTSDNELSAESEPTASILNDLVCPTLKRVEKKREEVCQLCKRLLHRWKERQSKVYNNRGGHTVLLALSNGVVQSVSGEGNV